MKRLVVPLAVTLLVAAAGCSIIPSPPRLFKQNAELKRQGYYMAEFEFKMLASLDQLNSGDYWEAYGTLRRIGHEMDTREGLVKVPSGASTDEFIDFMLKRQNAETGAFMDPQYPYFTYFGPTANVLDQLETASAKTGRPVKLLHPLRFLDRIRTPQQLRAYLDSYLYFKERWAEKFGGPAPYVAAVSELTGGTLTRFEQIGGYPLSDEWKEALTQWFYETQDPETGFWGVRIGDKEHWRQARDIDSTAHILKHFLTERGEPRDPRFPLRYAEPLARTLLKEAAAPVPEDEVEQHEWSLRQAHTAKILTRWLWPSLSAAMREQALQAMPRWLDDRFSMYRPDEGGFAVDSSSPHADIDATTTAITFLGEVGFLPTSWKRERIRGQALAAEPELVRAALARWEEATAPTAAEVNSIRVYQDRLPVGESWDDSTLVRIVYPHETRILDVMDLRQGLGKYMAAAGGEFGNWTTKESLRDEAMALDQAIRPVKTVKGSLDLAQVAQEHPEATRFFVVGLDRFQLPVSRHEYQLAVKP